MKKMVFFMLMALGCSAVSAQINQKDKDDFFGKEDKDDFFGKGTKDDFFSKDDPGFAAERNKMYENYNKFRKEALESYSDFVRKAWKDYQADPAVPAPKDERVEPQLAPGADKETAALFSKLFGKQPRKAPAAKPQPANKKPVEFKVQEVVQPEPVKPQPQPQIAAEEVKANSNNYMKFLVFGTECQVRIGENCRYKLADVKSSTVADAIKYVFPGQQFENLLYDCLQERKNHNFSDWAYYQMLQSLTRQFYGDTNEAVLVQAFLFSQSGYKMRLAHTENKLYMLAATRHFIYNKQFFSLDGDWYFLFSNDQPQSLGICQASFPKESSLSLQISTEQMLSDNPAVTRTIKSRKNPDFSFTITSNKNYIEFYDTYPSSMVENNFMTRWAMYANSPLEKGIRDQLYPQMKEKLAQYDQFQAVQQLLWWMHGMIDLDGVVKNSDTFLYRYDEDIWGCDRAFFGEETLFYPYCDCEDRSILLSRLVRDLVGLDVVLVHYPGHLAMAVNFTVETPEYCDYVMYGGRKFIICDPTYLGSKVGETMSGLEGAPTTLILLQKS